MKERGSHIFLIILGRSQLTPCRILLIYFIEYLYWQKNSVRALLEERDGSVRVVLEERDGSVMVVLEERDGSVRAVLEERDGSVRAVLEQ